MTLLEVCRVDSKVFAVRLTGLQDEILSTLRISGFVVNTSFSMYLDVMLDRSFKPVTFTMMSQQYNVFTSICQ